jgi:hypothetical protein
MNRNQALEAAQQIGVSPGDHITLQNERMMEPHLHRRDDPSPPHVDAWHVANVGGTLQATKIHSDDR